MFAIQLTIMKLAILANEVQREEWLSKPAKEGVKVIWVTNHSELLNQKADVYFNLLFQPGRESLVSYASLNAPIFINEVVSPFSSMMKEASSISNGVFRLNAWPTFLKRTVVELCPSKFDDLQKAINIFSALGWEFKSTPDIPGLITARVIAMIINEAYFTLQDEVSTKEEIDIAMKLGTNYPYGPFEWSELIGLHNIYKLLLEMSKTDPRYTPSELLKKESEQLSAWH